MIVDVANGLSLDYHEVESDVDIASQHYAFLVHEDEFDEIFGRVVARGLEHWADPAKRHAGDINHNDGGRGVYFDDPDGHTYQLWAKVGEGDAARMVSLGVLGSTPAISPFRLTATPTMFEVTAEPGSGSSTPGASVVLRGDVA
jgi:hypothetical protein